MPTVKVVLYNRTYSDGTSPVMLRAYSNGRTKYKVLFSILPKHWNGKRVKNTHPDHVQLNKVIETHLRDSQIAIYDKQAIREPISPEQILFTKKGRFLEDAFDNYIDLLKKADKNNSARKYENVKDHAERFRARSLLSDVDLHWFKSFLAYLGNTDGINSVGTVYRYSKFLKTVLRAEFDRGNFKHVQVLTHKVKNEQAIKTILTPEELSKFKLVRASGALEIAKDAFLLQIYFRGMRIGDLLQLRRANVTGGYVQYIAQKTSKAYKIEIIEDAAIILEKYHASSLYLLPILSQRPQNPKKYPKFQKHIESKTAIINRRLKELATLAKINKRLTTHVARHTFAFIADQANLPLTTIQNLLGHSSPSQTDGYLKAIRKSSDLDDAVRGLF